MPIMDDRGGPLGQVSQVVIEPPSGTVGVSSPTHERAIDSGVSVTIPKDSTERPAPVAKSVAIREATICANNWLRYGEAHWARQSLRGLSRQTDQVIDLLRSLCDYDGPGGERAIIELYIEESRVRLRGWEEAHPIVTTTNPSGVQTITRVGCSCVTTRTPIGDSSYLARGNEVDIPGQMFNDTRTIASAILRWVRLVESQVAKAKSLIARNGVSGSEPPPECFKPMAWFTIRCPGIDSRIRMAASPGRKTKRVRVMLHDGVLLYSVADAMQWWADDLKESTEPQALASVNMRQRPSVSTTPVTSSLKPRHLA